MPKTWENFQITNKMLKYASKIASLDERFRNLPVEKKWIEQIRLQSIGEVVINGLRLDGQVVEIDKKNSVSSIKNDITKQRVLNEIELRNSFPIYFGKNELEIEQINYIHRFIDNVSDPEAGQRGRYRKNQKSDTIALYKPLKNVLPRYGFLPRLVGELTADINNSKMHELLLSGLIWGELIRLSMYSRANNQLARLVSKGFLYIRGFDTNQLLSIESVLLESRGQYYHAINKYLKDEPEIWVEMYLRAIVQAFKDLASKIEDVSGSTIRPLENEVIYLTKRQKTIVELLRKNVQLSGSEIGMILGVTRQNIFVIMQKLIAKKVVEKVGRGTTSRYRLKNLK
jgi:hypothetical protein